MNDLQIKVLKTKPAIVNFNFEEISNQLDSILTNYKGLVFTDETISDCKKTIAELRKGQKSLDDFRKDTKKSLTVSITAFEAQCKLLYERFDAVINPLSEQYDQFETDRKETKRKQIEDIIISLKQELQLTEKYASRLTIPEEYLNKGKSIKDIYTELANSTKSLKIEQDKEAQDIDLIKTKVELANAKYQLSVGLADGSYLSMLSFKTVDEIVRQIDADATFLQEKEKRNKEKLEAQIEESKEIKPQPIQSIQLGAASPIASTQEKVSTEYYAITATEAQFDALEAFLNANKYKWDYK